MTKPSHLSSLLVVRRLPGLGVADAADLVGRDLVDHVFHFGVGRNFDVGGRDRNLRQFRFRRDLGSGSRPADPFRPDFRLRLHRLKKKKFGLKPPTLSFPKLLRLVLTLFTTRNPI